ncbi:MAG TPA: type II toxin-antitoxin system VapC family toxin [Natronosporangium sp.]
MRLLLDTHVLLWWLDDSPALGVKARELISLGENEVFVSAISAAEIASKSSVGKLRVPADLEQQIEENAFTPLPFRVRHGLAVETLPLHHRDPFDRLLIAQAQCEDLAVVTADQVFAAYDVRTVDARVSP